MNWDIYENIRWVTRYDPGVTSRHAGMGGTSSATPEFYRTSESKERRSLRIRNDRPHAKVLSKPFCARRHPRIYQFRLTVVSTTASVEERSSIPLLLTLYRQPRLHRPNIAPQRV